MASRARRVGVVLLSAIVLSVAGCGDDGPDAAESDCYRIRNGEVTLVGENLVWDKTCLRVRQGTEVTFTVDLRDDGVEHNLEVFGPNGREKTELEPGPTTQTLVYDFAIDGHHQYVCKIHPAMEGDIWADPR